MNLNYLGISLTSTEIKNDLTGNALTAFTVFGILGVEYAINAAVSLAAEYHLGFTFGSGPDEVTKDTSGTETSKKGSKYSYFGITSVGILTLSIF